MKSSEPSPSSKRARRPAKSRDRLLGISSSWRALAWTLGVALLLGTVSYQCVQWVAARGYTLYYGDAEAHLNIARRILDTRTPNGEQVGTVWLPAPHALMLPFVGNDSLWRSGLAGAIPAAICFVLAGCLLFDLTRRALGSATAALTATALFALNPNMLYLQSIPMTEAVFFAGLLGLLHATVWHAQADSKISAWFAALSGAGFATLASMSRYEGWFLLPFAALFFCFGPRGSFVRASVFSLLAALGPLAWLAHNWWYWGDPLEFYRGQWSAAGIYKHQLEAGMSAYPGDHDWAKAILYYRTAVTLVVGTPLALLGVAGFFAAFWKRAWWIAGFLALGPLFYVWSMHSSGTPIFIPTLWPNSYYNTRYALAFLPLAAFGGAALVSLVSPRGRPFVALAAVGLALIPWIARPREDAWVCFKESQVNSDKRRAWTHEAAAYLKAHYQQGSGILMPFGDMTAVLREAGIPLRDSLHEGNHPAFESILARPELFLNTGWALAFSGDPIATALLRADKRGKHYRCVRTIAISGAPVVEIYRRDWIPPEAKETEP
ncbi:MAG: glycosyltransferase family 39 protein [Bryobacteraceae bacterium]